MVTNKYSKYIFPWPLHFVHVLNALVHKSSDLVGFNQTHNAATFSSKYKTFALQVAYITPRQQRFHPSVKHLLYK